MLFAQVPTYIQFQALRHGCVNCIRACAVAVWIFGCPTSP